MFFLLLLFILALTAFTSVQDSFPTSGLIIFKQLSFFSIDTSGGFNKNDP